MFSGTRSTDTRGVAPVIGIVLLIGITVILAATVAAFAFGLEEQSSQGKVPTVALSTGYDAGSSDEVTFSHESGEIVEIQNLYVTIDGATCSGSADPTGSHDVSDIAPSLTEFSSGRTIPVNSTGIDGSTGSTCGDLDLGSATVRLSWRTGAGSSTTVRTWNGPT